jgi:hypothetical protein
MNARTLTSIAGIALATGALGATQLAAGATPARTVRVSAQLKVASTVNGLGGAPQSCSAGICKIENRGTGRMTHFGNVTFTSVITADDNQPPCGTNSQWVNRIIRTIHTNHGTLVLHEAGLQCPQPGVGPRVDAVWTVDGADSTGIFAGAQGRGDDTAYPARDTAAPQGTISLAR